jgi:hypothetical protein
MSWLWFFPGKLFTKFGLAYSAAKFTIFHVNSREFTKKIHTFSRNLFFTGMNGKQRLK